MTAPIEVLVLSGGLSAEREVSLATGDACAAWCRDAGLNTTQYDFGQDLDDLLRRLGRNAAKKVVFNALHGEFGEDGGLQTLLDKLSVPYTHSGAHASRLAMHKPSAKTLWRQIGIPVVDHVCVRAEMVRDWMEKGSWPFSRCVVKPIDSGSSIDVAVMAADGKTFSGTLPKSPHKGLLMVEEYVAGRELTVGVMEGQAITVTEVVSRNAFYDYHGKYSTSDGDEHLCPAPLTADEFERVCAVSEQAYEILGCRGMARVDLRYDHRPGGVGLVVLELNTVPGMTAQSLVPEQIRAVGGNVVQTVARIVEIACYDSVSR